MLMLMLILMRLEKLFAFPCWQASSTSSSTTTSRFGASGAFAAGTLCLLFANLGTQLCFGCLFLCFGQLWLGRFRFAFLNEKLLSLSFAELVATTMKQRIRVL